ncbi:hypothetical protein [Lysobacter sp. Hz 25]|uniref:hypothetical protein n=1 Tax=Lysobacter sp. Hz 25 TaxID=3383698 RepID=UPI0038D3F3A8
MAIRDGELTIAYVAETTLPSGELLSETFLLGRRSAATVMALAIAEKRQQLSRAHVESGRRQNGAKPKRAGRVRPKPKLKVINPKREAAIAAGIMAYEVVTGREDRIESIQRLPEELGVGGWRVSKRQRGRKVRRMFLDTAYGGAAPAYAQALIFKEGPGAPRPSVAP